MLPRRGLPSATPYLTATPPEHYFLRKPEPLPPAATSGRLQPPLEATPRSATASLGFVSSRAVPTTTSLKPSAAGTPIPLCEVSSASLHHLRSPSAALGMETALADPSGPLSTPQGCGAPCMATSSPKPVATEAPSSLLSHTGHHHILIAELHTPPSLPSAAR